MASSMVSRISISMPETLLRELDRMVEQRVFESRSRAISDMLHQFLAEHKRQRNDQLMVGTVTLFYDNSVAGLQNRLSDLQYRLIPQLHPHI
jgi:CopG family nickel-responsive transcriptional regulator